MNEFFLGLALALQFNAVATDTRPVVSDLTRFPPRCVCQDNIRFNWLYRQHLEARQGLYGSRSDLWWECQDALDDAVCLYCVWDTLDTAWVLDEEHDACREWLAKLRCRLGPTAYFRGQMPVCVPVWRFQEMDP